MFSCWPPIGVTDVIRDFQVGIDRIDLSGWGRVYSVDELKVVARTGGATIIFGNETLTVLSANGQVIQPAVFTSPDPFGLWHALGDPVGPRCLAARQFRTLRHIRRRYPAGHHCGHLYRRAGRI